jgi:hypothetical protein
LKQFIARLSEVVSDYNRRWGPLGVLLVVLLFALSFVANFVQLAGSFPQNQSQTVEIPTVYLILIVILAIMAISTLLVQLGGMLRSIAKRGHITQLTDIYVIHNRGELFHGGMRHVLFKLGTVQEIMHAIFINEAQYSSVEIQLYEVGERVGQGFADGFIDAIDQRRVLPGDRSLIDMIDLWCEFDVSGGWGKFIFFPGASEFQGRIEIRSNFLTVPSENPTLDSKSLCKFIEGYIAGILVIFARVAHPVITWEAQVEERECGIRSGGLKPCIFDFAVKAITTK